MSVFCDEAITVQHSEQATLGIASQKPLAMTEWAEQLPFF